MRKSRFIVFEGPIAVGKTTHAQLLAKFFDFQLFLEDFEGNEFLADFYGNRERWALPMQLWFLAERYQQLNRIAENTPKVIVADYSPVKNRIFAGLLLKDRELRLYDKLDSSLISKVRQPDLVVLLDAKNEVLLDRIRQRNRPYEVENIDSRYLDELRNAYKHHFASSAIAVLSHDTSDLDLASEDQLRLFYSTIAKAIEATE